MVTSGRDNYCDSAALSSTRKKSLRTLVGRFGRHFKQLRQAEDASTTRALLGGADDEYVVVFETARKPSTPVIEFAEFVSHSPVCAPRVASL